MCNWLFHNKRGVQVWGFILSELDREMINYRAVFRVRLWINMFSIHMVVYKQETHTACQQFDLKKKHQLSIHH